MSLAFSILAALLSSSDSDPLIYTVIGAGLGVLLFVKGFRALQRKRLIMDTPTAKVRSAAIGLVELQGTAVGPFTFIAPLTRVPCYYHRTQLYKWVQRGKSSEWEKVADECLHVPFYLKDPTGMVLVDPNGAEMELHCDYKQEFNHSLFGSTSIPGPVMEFMNRYGVGTNHSIKVEEYCIKPDNALFILGTLATNSGLRPVPSPMSTLAGSFKLGHWTLNMGGGPNLAAQLISGNLGGPALASLLAGGTTTTTVTTTSGDWGSARKTVSVTTNAPKTETLQPGDPRAAAAVAAIAAKDPALAARVAAQLNIPYPPPAGAAQPNPSVSVSEIPGGVKITSRQVTNLAVPVPGGTPLMPAQAHQLAVAALAAKDPALATVVANMLGRPEVAAAIQKAAGGDAPAAATAPGPNGGAWPDHDPTVVMKGTHNPAYFISWQSQKEVIKELSRRSVLMIWGGPVLTVVCMLYILGRFGLL
ncbi:MAG TPA: GIDE domain-containing protein [Terriglobales bacterium]|jgi:hypothetical protein|nr:GIDE domain-containing protein [Terriglobales bacterium]